MGLVLRLGPCGGLTRGGVLPGLLRCRVLERLVSLTGVLVQSKERSQLGPAMMTPVDWGLKQNQSRRLQVGGGHLEAPVPEPQPPPSRARPVAASWRHIQWRSPRTRRGALDGGSGLPAACDRN